MIIQSFHILKIDTPHAKLHGCLKIFARIVPDIDHLLIGNPPSALQNPKGNVAGLTELYSAQFIGNDNIIHHLVKPQCLDLILLPFHPSVRDDPDAASLCT